MILAMPMGSVLFRKKHCKAVSDIGILYFQFAFVVKKGRGEGREKERKKKRMLDTINPLYTHTQKTTVYFFNCSWKVVYFYILAASVFGNNGRKLFKI